MVATNTRGNSPASLASAPFTPSVASCANGRTVCVVGDTGPGGGTVFYVSNSAFTETDAPCGSGCKYLEVAPADWNGSGTSDPALPWETGSCANQDVGANGTELGSGFANTAAITLACPEANGGQSNLAARAASTYAPTVGSVVVSGWFLPSLDELAALDTSGLDVVTRPNTYWSSSQWESGRTFVAHTWYFADGGGSAPLLGSKAFAFSVRPIRAF